MPRVKVDNSATRQIANKLGTSKLRHVQGKLLWVQQQVKDGVLAIRQITTMFNPADLGTKGLSRRRHNLLLYLFGFVDEKSEGVGEAEYREHDLLEKTMQAIKRVKLTFPEEMSVSSSTSSQLAKQAVRVAMLQKVGALGQTVAVDDSVEPNTNHDDDGVFNFALNFQILRWVCFAGVMITIILVLVCMVVDESGDSGSEESPEHRRRRYLFSTMNETSDPEYWMQLNHHDDMSDSENDGPEVDEAGPQASTPLQYGMFHVYLFMQGNFQRLRHLMQTDHAMQGHGYTILTWLLKVLKDYETNAITSGRVRHMTLLHGSISEMEQVVLERGGSTIAIQDIGQGQIYQSFSDNLQLEPEGEEPTPQEIEEQGIRLWREEIPEPETDGSPESMGQMDDQTTDSSYRPWMC